MTDENTVAEPREQSNADGNPQPATGDVLLYTTDGLGLRSVPSLLGVVQFLQTHGGAVPFDDLAAGLAVRRPTTTDGPSVASIRIQLHHNWLPRLAEQQLLRRDGNIVSLTVIGRRLPTLVAGVDPRNIESSSGISE